MQGGTTAGSSAASRRMSIHSYSCIENGGERSGRDRIEWNAMYLAANMSRFQGFHKMWGVFTLIVRMLQNYTIIVMPSCGVLWGEDEAGSGLVRWLSAGLRADVGVGVRNNYMRVDMILMVIIWIAFGVFAHVIWRDPLTYSTSNVTIYFMRWVCSVMTPIVSIWVASVGGNLAYALMNEGGVLFGLSRCFFMAMNVVGLLLLKWIGVVLIGNCSTLDFEESMRPWAVYSGRYELIEMAFGILAFFQGAFNLNIKRTGVVFSIMCMIVMNPFVAWLLISRPIFQDVSLIPMYAMQFIAGCLTMALFYLRSGMTPVGVLSISVLGYFVSYLFLKVIVQIKINRCTKKLFEVYKRKSAGIARPLSTLGHNETQVVLSNEAYAIVEAFESLEIKTANEFQYYLCVGVLGRIPAVQNMDFIKWGIEQFNDKYVLAVCQQICQYFGGDVHMQQILIQKIRDREGISLTTYAMIHCMEMHHADTIIAEPLFLKGLLGKARSSLDRSRRALARFWGCVLQQSNALMEDSMCQIRDSINEAGVHFEELIRCYPFSSAAVELNLTFMTEMKGTYLACNEYMSRTAAQYSDKYGMMDGDSRSEKKVAVVDNPTKLFAAHTLRIRRHVQQERFASQGVKRMPGVIWAITVFTGGTILLYLLLMLAVLETAFIQQYGLVDIIVEGNIANVDLVLLLIGIRRLCFHANGLQPPQLQFDGCHVPAMDDRERIVPYLTELSESSFAKAASFFERAGKFNWTSYGLVADPIAMTGYGNKLYMYEPLGFVMDLFGNVMRNSLTNAPKRFGDETRGESNWYDYTTTEHMYEAEDFGDICLARETASPMENLNSIAQLVLTFGNCFCEAGKLLSSELDVFLMFSKLYFPISIVCLFAVLLLISIIFLHIEGKFRLTLFLALPEVAVSDMCKASADRKERNLDQTGQRDVTEPGSSTAETSPGENGAALVAPDMEMWEAKKHVVESLYQFSTTTSAVHGVGLKQYVLWYIISLIVGIGAILIVSQYAQGINDELLGWSTKICYSMVRLVWTQMSAVCMGDVFIAAVDTDLLLSRSMYELASVYGNLFLERARILHRQLVYGDSVMSFDFREVDIVTDLSLKPVSIDRPASMPEQRHAELSLHHDGYRESGTDLFFELFCFSTRCVIGMVEKEFGQTIWTNRYKMWSTINISTNRWDEYQHLNTGHVMEQFNNETLLYCDHVRDVIDNVMVMTLLVLVIVCVILLIFVIGPLRIISRGVYEYFDMLVHVLIQIPPEVFHSSIYINKWLKGQISMSNYDQYRTTMSRSVPAEVQHAAVAESPERIMIFDPEGQYVLGMGSYSDGQINERESKTVSGIIGLEIDVKSEVKLIDELEKIITRFREARDSLDNVTMKAVGTNCGYVRLRIVGINSTDSHEAHNYYSFVAILINDITEELSQISQLNVCRERTLNILSAHIPMYVANIFDTTNGNYQFTSDLVTVMTVREECFEQELWLLNSEECMAISDKYREHLQDALSSFRSVIPIAAYGRDMIYAAGIFDEESTGQKEACEMIQFCMKIEEFWLYAKENLNWARSKRRYAICTGGPVIYKMIVDGVPRSLLTGKLTRQTDAILAGCQGLTIDQTTYHCSIEAGFEVQPLEDFKFRGESIPLFRVNMTPNVSGSVAELGSMDFK